MQTSIARKWFLGGGGCFRVVWHSLASEVYQNLNYTVLVGTSTSCNKTAYITQVYLHNLHVWFILVLSISPPILSISSHILVHSQGICLLKFSDLDQSFKWDQHRIVSTSTIPRGSKFLAAAMKQYSEYSIYNIIEGSLNSKLPTIWRVEKQMRQAVNSEGRRCVSAKVRRKKTHPRQMLERLRNAAFFQWFVCPVSRKVGLLKRRVRSHVVRGEIKNCTPLWQKTHLEVKMLKKTDGLGALFEVAMLKNCTRLWRKEHSEMKMYKTPHGRSTFWSSGVEKLHAAVAKTTLLSQNVKKLGAWDHFLKFRCRKTARRCGEKHIWKWKCWKKLTVSEHFLKLRCRIIARGCGEKRILKWKCAKHVSSGQFFEVLMSKN